MKNEIRLHLKFINIRYILKNGTLVYKYKPSPENHSIIDHTLKFMLLT